MIFGSNKPKTNCMQEGNKKGADNTQVKDCRREVGRCLMREMNH